MLEPFWYRSMYMFVLLATLSLRMSDDVSVPASLASSGDDVHMLTSLTSLL